MKRIIVFALLLLTMGLVKQTACAAEPAKAESIEYTLPYPGILPDHPLYKMKLLRDFIVERIIVEPVRKSEFYLLQADKRLEMGILLIEQEKYTLSETTISKAEKYLEKAVSGLAAYKSVGNTIPPYVVERMSTAAAKHKEIITDLMSKAPSEVNPGFSSSLVLTESLVAEAEKLK